MTLPITQPFSPMEAQHVTRLPDGDNWLFEPKWDGFRCLAFKDGRDVALQSKSEKPLGRYFPELVEKLRSLSPEAFALDGEIVVPVKGVFSFDDLLQRIHPAQSRVNRLAREYPATLIVFDLLVDDRRQLLTGMPLSERRQRLEAFADSYLKNKPGFALSETTSDRQVALGWLESENFNLDGVMAKRSDLPYKGGERTMRKVKRTRTADCVVGGFRYSAASYEGEAVSENREKREVGSLLLGLYDRDGLLHHVGFCSGLRQTEKKQLVGQLESLIATPGFSGRKPGGPSRWGTRHSEDWQPLAPRLVVEVKWDHFTGGRFRHGTKLLRWRPDKAPEQCTLDQVDKTAGGGA